MNIYKTNCQAYIDKGFSVIPDKYGSKLPAISKWTNYCRKLPSTIEVNKWSNEFEKSNIAMCLGAASGLVVLDFDATDPKLIELIEGILPPSPVERVGSKGWARFFRFTGEHTQTLKHNGSVVIELLSTNKKITLPPSLHPNGCHYKWTDTSILDIDIETLPLLPPYLFSHIESKLRVASPETHITGGKVISGRNDALSSLCGTLIKEAKPVDEAILQLVNFDKENNDPPLFADLEEMRHTEPFSNALAFYSNHLQSINNSRCRDRKEYEVPVTASAINAEHLDIVLKKKDKKAEKPKNQNVKLPTPMGILKEIQDLILSNSFIKQPELAFSAALALFSTILGRKITFLNNSPNLYLLNVAPSGAGKDAPQQTIKQIMIDLKIDHLMGSGDYVSDASLTDSLEYQNTRLDIIDEASGMLKSVNKSGTEYSRKMSEILCELYTSSNSKFLGRRLGGGERRGECLRPFVSLLMSTTPTGFEEGVSRTAIEKGLMGRVLVFRGDADRHAERINKVNKVSQKLESMLLFWNSYEPPVAVSFSGNIGMDYLELEASKEGGQRLDLIFEELDTMRRGAESGSDMLPIIARMFQQTCKLALIHACSREFTKIPKVEIEDVNFAYKAILYNFHIFKQVLKCSIHGSDYEASYKKMRNYVVSREGVTSSQLANNFRNILPRVRKEIIIDMIDSQDIKVDSRSESGRLIYKGVEE